MLRARAGVERKETALQQHQGHAGPQDRQAQQRRIQIALGLRDDVAATGDRDPPRTLAVVAGAVPFSITPECVAVRIQILESLLNLAEADANVCCALGGIEPSRGNYESRTKAWA
ncbi:MAG: hypothetical protein ACYTKC_22900 [Planctomycetota bacterium]|jgi:hypothetical protein